MDLDIEAPIIPDVGLGGILLRDRIINAQDLVSDRWGGSARLTGFELVSPFEAMYTFLRGAVTVHVDVRNGKIFMISAGSGYRGLLFDRIHVGMKLRDAMMAEPRLYYDEGDGSIFCREIPGLSVDPSQDDPLPSSIPGLEIRSINVYASETRSLSAQQGRW